MSARRLIGCNPVLFRKADRDHAEVAFEVERPFLRESSRTETDWLIEDILRIGDGTAALTGVSMPCCTAPTG